MYRRAWSRSVLVLVMVMLNACRPTTPQPMPSPVPTPTPSMTGAEEVAREYLLAWQQGAYERMYGLLSSSAAASIPEDSFVARYRAIAEEATLTSLTASISEVQRVMTAAATVTFTLSLDTRMAGHCQIENALDLVAEGQRWAVNWTPKAIFPLLLRDNLVHMFIHAPARGSIYDNKDLPLAEEGQVIEVGVVTGQIDDEAHMLDVLSNLLALPTEKIRSRYQHDGYPDWFMPVGEIDTTVAQANATLLSSVPGIVWREKAVRSYPHGSLASQVVGYMAEIDAETLGKLESKGYSSGDMLGVSGLEGWGEQYLAGERGGTLAIISPDGRIVWTLAERQAVASRSIYTTLDVGMQQTAEAILGQRVGAIVVLDVHNGDVLALASYPRYDPSVLTAGATTEQWQALLSNQQHPFLNRAIAGIYPPGSTFKLVTISAGLEALGLTANSPFYCAGRWDGVADGATRYCWLKTGHGSIDLFDGLAQSCDTVFWEVGKALNQLDPMTLPRYARSFGLGAGSGLNALEEADGLIPDPEWKRQNYSGAEQEWLVRDAVNMAIGQGDVLVTPLQMANLVSAVANGGTLYRTRLVRRIGSLMGDDIQDFPPTTLGQLPVSAQHLQMLRSAMESVITSGTAWTAFSGATVRMAGKSGTAEAPPGEPHGWFVGYAPADDPQIAVAVVLEHGGEGGRNAAPLFRQVVETYMSRSQ